MGILADNELTPKQQLFVDAYLSNGFNGVDAARKAGYKGEYNTLKQVAAENLARPYLRSAIERRTQPLVKQREKRIVDTYEEFTKNLEFVSKLRDAAREWLCDPDSDGFTIAPRGDEIDIVYFDYEDLDQQRKPKRKTANLQDVLARLQGTRYEPDTQYVKTMDLRDFALKTVDRIDATLDKFAKMGGDYTQDKKNPADNKTIIEETIRELMAENIPEEQIREVLAERYPETVH